MTSPTILPPIKAINGGVFEPENKNSSHLNTIHSSSSCTTISTQAMLITKKENEKAKMKVNEELKTILDSEDVEDDKWNKKSLIQKASAVASKAAADFARALVDYGPVSFTIPMLHIYFLILLNHI